ncbi:hypothetical protein IQ283_09185 (plasmid) [Alkalihalobacillus hwajinpoensis]|uniref:hypothetical protein n=1 Tax=Guptibacillus hwajinpoensis TaxID=208199 RepID=UPI001883CDF3|nr:hypothetical protein [Pseudalkalibacillus hwajinpoensis]MBF0706781.1 hypothetical protein [Pseudalkalibacillus hwajinpoensis]
MKRVLMYFLKSLVSPLSLFIVWVYGLKPFSILSDIFKWEIKAAKPEIIKGGIDVAVLLFLINLLGKLLLYLRELIYKYTPSVKISIINPKDPDKSNFILCEPGGELNSIKAQVEIDYKNTFGKFISTFGKEQYLEFYWNYEWVSINFNSIVKGENIKDGVWKCKVANTLPKNQFDTSLDIPMYISIDHDQVKKGYITSNLILCTKVKDNHLFLSWLSRKFIFYEVTPLTIKLSI